MSQLHAGLPSRGSLGHTPCFCVQKTQTQRHTSQNLGRLLEGLGGREGWRQMWTWEEEETEPDSAKQCFPPGARSNLTLPKPGSLPSPERGSFSRHKRNLALGQHLKTHQCFPLVDSYLEHLGLPCAAQHLLHSPLQLKGLHTGHSCCQNVLFSPLHLFSTYQSLRLESHSHCLKETFPRWLCPTLMRPRSLSSAGGQIPAYCSSVLHPYWGVHPSQRLDGRLDGRLADRCALKKLYLCSAGP